MALRHTYLSLKDKLPAGTECILVMRGRGNDELAPSSDLLDDFNARKAEYAPESGYATAYHYAWDKSQYERRFRAQIESDLKAKRRLKALSERAKQHDIFFICYEGDDKPCHRRLLLEIAQRDFGAPVDFSPVLPTEDCAVLRDAKGQEPTLF